MRLDALNALDEAAATGEFLRCCGSRRWAESMAAARPFGGAEPMAVAADVIWASLDRADWLEAVAAHPRIGGAGRAGTAGEAEWPAQEQAGVATAAATVRDRLAALNRAYEARFGYIFIVCATGKSAEEMLALLERRLTNDPETELGRAAEEQRKITRLRLAKLLGPANE